MKKRGLSEVVTMSLMISLVVIAVGIVFAVLSTQMNKISSGIECDTILTKGYFSFDEACYINNDEIKVKIKRDLSDLEFNSLFFGFHSPNEVDFRMSGSCLDIRDSDNGYGRVCFFPERNEQKTYIFNVSGEERLNQAIFGVYLEDVGDLCILEERVLTDCS